MSLDRGADADGLDRTPEGSYPIGTLRLGPAATRVATASESRVRECRVRRAAARGP